MLCPMASWLLFPLCLLVLLLRPPAAAPYTVTGSGIDPLGYKHSIGLSRGREDSPYGSTESTERKTCTNCGQTKDLAGADFEALRAVLKRFEGLQYPRFEGKTGERGQD